MNPRRNFLRAGAALLTAASVSHAAQAAVPEAAMQDKPDTQPPLAPPGGSPYNPVVTLNGWTLPWRMNNGVKEFHLVAEPVVREMAPGFRAHLWGYNGQSPGPTIEVVEGDRVRIVVENHLPEVFVPHWHGLEVPIGMDGAPGISQPEVKPGESFTYDFVVPDAGLFWYHPHVASAKQVGFGLYGGVIIFPLFTQSILGFSPTETGLAMMPGGVATAVMARWEGELAPAGGSVGVTPAAPSPPKLS